MQHSCYRCAANWSAGAFTEGCRECDGAALQKPCPLCEGECSVPWARAIDDSHEYGRGCWVQTGPCGLGLTWEDAAKREMAKQKSSTD